ncbi:hypothetical protein G5V58_15620 [Nocardioides anomalus]|uniref:Uncharacterized protein n=1 Tax=Nocardioides anomalus TaxID=2712223 RepID=A0A6G6WFK5_9ACTN|nr:hypothetical protein [Nocardioides anomalus]QIG44014.1 hypothetical protein G5V58_15620 [Nocardioides anomalus]
MRRLGPVLVAGLLLLTGAASAPVGSAAPPAGFAWRVLTSGPERFAVATEGRGVTITGLAPTGVVPPFWNRRQVLVPRGARPARDQTVCATWVRETNWSNQQGLAVRVSRPHGGPLRALTLTKNVFGHATWWINLLSWRGQEFTTLGQFDMSGVVSQDGERVRAFPWRICLRAEGERLGFKVWLPRREPEPAWDDPGHTAWVSAPERSGLAGWYAGHLAPGDQLRYADLGVTAD